MSVLGETARWFLLIGAGKNSGTAPEWSAAGSAVYLIFKPCAREQEEEFVAAPGVESGAESGVESEMVRQVLSYLAKSAYFCI